MILFLLIVYPKIATKQIASKVAWIILTVLLLKLSAITLKIFSPAKPPHNDPSDIDITIFKSKLNPFFNCFPIETIHIVNTARVE